MITVVGGIKGGTGKSTISTNLAAWLAVENQDVILIDANPGQTTSSNWVSRRNENLAKIHCVEKSNDLRETLKDFDKRYDQMPIKTLLIASSFLQLTYQTHESLNLYKI